MIMRIIVTILMVISFSCEVSRPQGYSSNDNSTTLGLLDRLRSIPGLRIGGVGERDAQVYLRGQTSIKYYQEVNVEDLFIFSVKIILSSLLLKIIILILLQIV